MDATTLIDVFELARRNQTRSGSTKLSHFARLIEGLPRQLDVQVEWELTGRAAGAGQLFLSVQARTTLILECQRCLGPLKWPVEVADVVQLVEFESELEGETDVDPDQLERIVGSHTFDVLSFVEDEIILAVPYVPRHEVCPSGPGPVVSNDPPEFESARPSPFAVLSKLKKD